MSLCDMCAYLYETISIQVYMCIVHIQCDAQSNETFFL